MSIKPASAVLLKLFVLAVALGAGAVGTTTPVSAAPLPDRPESVQPFSRTVGGKLFVWGEEIALEPGQVVQMLHADSFELLEDANHRPTGQRLIADGDLIPSGKVKYRIVQLGKPTPYWVQIELSIRNQQVSRGTCEIFKGEPGRDVSAISPTWDSPFQCGTTQYGFDWDFNFFIEPAGVVAKSSGTIVPLDALTLTEGSFQTDGDYHRYGASTVQPGLLTKFFTVLTNKDKPFYYNQARTEFSYRIMENGANTDFWVAGISTNFSGARNFSPDGRCAIYASNPIAGGGRLDDHSPIEGSAYTCKATGEFKHDPGEVDNVHYHATFAVGRATRPAA